MGLIAACLLLLAAAVFLPISRDSSNLRLPGRSPLSPASAKDTLLPAPLAAAPASIPQRWHATPSNQAQAALPHLGFESPLTPGGRLSYDHALLALNNEHFDQYMQTIVEQSLRDAEAASVTALYAQNLNRTLQSDPDVSLEQFACGLRVCVGSIADRNNGTDGDVGRLMQQALRLDGMTPAYSMIELPFERGGQHRFILSLDESITEIEGATLP